MYGRKVQEDQVSLELNGTHQLMVCADDFHLLGGDMDTTRENTETPLETSRDVGPKINAERTKYMII
jgi:hypothetical protein